MSSNYEYGTEVDVDEIRSVLEPTRQIRLALDVLWGSLPQHIETKAIGESLTDLHERLCAEELRALRMFGVNQQYTIIRPLDMTNLPDADTMQKIAGAVQTLADLGLIAGPGDV